MKHYIAPTIRIHNTHIREHILEGSPLNVKIDRTQYSEDMDAKDNNSFGGIW